MTSAALKTILDHDIPELPPHWHDECDCEPTVAYLRVSKIGKRTKIVSPTIQLNEIIADARRNKRKIVKLVFDINKSGRDFDREAFQSVIDDIKAGEYKHVSVWKWSRFGRTIRGSLQMLTLLEEADGRVESASEPFDQDTVFGEFTRDQMLLIADLQSKVLGETWRGVHATRLDNQLPHSGRKRFGYDYFAEDERDKRYAPNPEEGPILKWAYEQYVAGVAMRKIVRAVNEKGFRTSFGNEWTWQAWAKMMDTGFAAGLIRGRSTAQKRAVKRKPANTRRSYDKWTEGKQEALISRELWEAYLARREEALTLPPRFAGAVHELSALVFCGICARRMTTKYAGTYRKHTWVCMSRDSFHPDKSVTVANDDAMMLVREWFEERSQPEWVEAESRRIFEAAQRVRPDVDALEKKLAAVDKKLDNAMALFLASENASEAVKTRVLKTLNGLEEERARLLEGKKAVAVPDSVPDFRALGVVAERWDEFEKDVHNAALRKALGMVLVSPPSAPRVRRELRERVRIVPAWEMEDWSEWLSARRQRAA